MANYAITVVAPAGEFLERMKKEEAEAVQFTGSGPSRGFWSVLKATRHAESVIVNGPRVLATCLVCAWWRKIPCILYLHSCPERRWQLLLLRILSRGAARRIVVCAALAPLVARPANIVHNRARPELAAERDEISERNDAVIKFLGRDDEIKGVALLVAALSALEGMGCLRPWHAELAIGKALEHVGNDARDSWVPSPLVKISGERDARWFSPGDIVCVPSRYEASPLVVHEAQIRGCVVVAFPVGGVGEIVKHNVNGVLVEQRTSDKLASCLRELIEDRRLRALLARRAHEDALERAGAWPQNIMSLVTG